MQSPAWRAARAAWAPPLKGAALAGGRLYLPLARLQSSEVPCRPAASPSQLPDGNPALLCWQPRGTLRPWQPLARHLTWLDTWRGPAQHAASPHYLRPSKHCTACAQTARCADS